MKLLHKISVLKADSIFDPLPPEMKTRNTDNPDFRIQMIGQNFTPVQIDIFLINKEWAVVKNDNGYFKVGRDKLYEIAEEVAYFRL
jgi:hypothetical protein